VSKSYKTVVISLAAFRSASIPFLQVEAMLQRSAGLAGSLGFDAHELAQLTGGQPLAAMAWWAISQAGLVQDLGLDAPALMR
jgi:hypothetical protein